MQYFDQELLNGTPQNHPLLGEYTIKKMDTLGYFMIKTKMGDFLLYLGNTVELSCDVYHFVAGYRQGDLKTWVLFFDWESILDSVFMMLNPGWETFKEICLR